MHPALEAIRSSTIGTPFEGDLFLVGGAVRDELLGEAALSDFDLVTQQSASELAELLWQKGLSSIPPVTYARFGTAMVRVMGVDIEFVTARRESYDPESRKPNVEPATYLEDAMRRDFTVNALEKNLHTGKIVDPLGKGLDDLRSQILRTPLDPVATFRDDPLRMLRAVRFRWKLGFDPAPGLYEGIKSESGRLSIVSAERVRDEFMKMLALPAASDCLRDLMDLGLIDQFVPEFRSMVGCEQGKFHFADVWEHTLKVLRNIGHGDPMLSLAALLHDVGKPETRTIDEHGNTRFFGHEAVGASMSRKILRRLKFSEKDIENISKLVKNHMRLGSAPTFSASAARRLVRDMGELVEPLLLLVEADSGALKAGVKVLDISSIRSQIDAVTVSIPTATFDSPISGSRIIELTGIPAGPQIGRLKQLLTEAVLEGHLAGDDVNGAETLVRELAKKQ